MDPVPLNSVQMNLPSNEVPSINPTKQNVEQNMQQNDMPKPNPEQINPPIFNHQPMNHMQHNFPYVMSPMQMNPMGNNMMMYNPIPMMSPPQQPQNIVINNQNANQQSGGNGNGSDQLSIPKWARKFRCPCCKTGIMYRRTRFWMTSLLSSSPYKASSYYHNTCHRYTNMANRNAGRTSGTAGPTKNCQFKLVLLGESAVGKSSLVLRFVKGQFHEYQESTIGAAFLTQTISLDDTTVKFEIWDTAGQERYHSLAPMYYRGAQAAIVVYDITSSESFTKAKNWVKELQRQAAPEIVIALAGNKADLAAKRVVDFDEAKAYADDNGLLFMETSAKTAQNVNDIFLAIAKKLPKNEGGGGPSGRGAGGINVADDAPQQKTNSCCNK